ncbi:unnamed protein product [Schistosoma curassoni]|uniref:Cytochrome c oxidase subunit 3 n=1 Tax=Schistosoma curassoni TaxID=6186 RepID=A0A183KXK8_9TREM|nr:unnamed protein product [Schistosoma curassoni]
MLIHCGIHIFFFSGIIVTFIIIIVIIIIEYIWNFWIIIRT